MTPIDLYVFAHFRHAENAGFRQGRHRDLPNVRAVYADSDPESIRGLHLARVIVSEAAHYEAGRSDAARRNLARLLDAARFALRVEPMSWVEF